MSYNYHILGMNKSVADKIRGCKTSSELYDYAKNELKCKDCVDDYIPIYNISDELYDFGSDLLGYEEMYSPDERFFTSDELNDMYQDYDARICTKDMLKGIINSYREHIIEMYTHLKNNTTFNDFENDRISKMTEDEKKEYHYQTLLEHISDQLLHWRFGTFRFDGDRITDSWLYELAIFEILRIYKTFDWDNNTMIIMGW